ncbi:hypothetical protein G6F55_013917 [Rhizopus delemar]|nr:hypothetical protein G6F55_013917 [Rhizopus delemar]
MVNRCHHASRSAPRPLSRRVRPAAHPRWSPVRHAFAHPCTVPVRSAGRCARTCRRGPPARRAAAGQGGRGRTPAPMARRPGARRKQPGTAGARG